MPHIVVNVWPGRSDEEKRALANRIALDVAEVFQMDTEYVSVAYEEVPEAEWDAFCQREIDEKLDKVYKNCLGGDVTLPRQFFYSFCGARRNIHRAVQNSRTLSH